MSESYEVAYLSMMPAPTPVLVIAPFSSGIPSTAVSTVCESGSLGYTRGTVKTTTKWFTVGGSRAHLHIIDCMT